MMLAVDIGNTTISFAVLKGQKIKQVYSLKTHLPAALLTKELQKLFGKIKNRFPFIKAVVICSVVPRATAFLKPIAKQIFEIKPIVLGADITVPIKNCYRVPRQVGQDRLVCAYAAKMLYGAPAIIVDFGTAITFDAVSKKGEYLGGAIVPGFRLYAESLFEKTALLPKVKLHFPEGVIGKDTQNSILSGIFYGYSSLYRGMIELMARQLKGKPVVVITGGYSPLIRKFIKKVDAINRFLIFDGMYLIYQSHVKGGRVDRAIRAS